VLCVNLSLHVNKR